MTPEEVARFETLEAEARDLAAQIDREERVRAIVQTPAEPNQARGVRPDPGQNGVGSVPVDPYGGRFRSRADFLAAFVARDPELRDMQTNIGAQGGLLVPNPPRAEGVLSITPESAIVRPRALVIPAGEPPDAPYSMVAMRQGALGVYGGLAFPPVAEGGAKPQTEPSLVEITLEPHEFAGHAVVTDKQLRNAPATGVFLEQQFLRAKAGQEDFRFLRGNGVNEPLGVLNAPCLIQLARAAAGAIGFADVVGMMARLNPDSWGSAVFTANLTTLPQLASMQDTAGNSIFIAGDITKKIPATLLGMPIRFTGRLPVLGQMGDLLLADFSQYLIKDGSGPFVAWSEHVYFLSNRTAVKFFWNADGQPWWTEALLLEDGVTTVSPFVALQ